MAQLLDGDHDLVSLLGEAATRWGADGPARLARLLAELADKGMLAGVESDETPAGSLPWLARLVRPRERELPGVPQAMAAVYRRGGWLLFTLGRARGAGGDRPRGPGRLRRPDHRALRHAVRGGAAGRARGARVRRRRASPSSSATSSPTA